MFAPDTSFNSSAVFDIGKIIEFNEGFYDIVTSTFMEKLAALPIAGTYKVTTERFRPDLVAYRIYGSEQYKIILLMYNNLNSYLDIVPGMELVYPTLRNVESILFDAKVR